VIDMAGFKPKTVYVTYIAATPDKVWQALTDPAFTAQYFFGRRDRAEGRRLVSDANAGWARGR
jgi:uncharacterized protein YndB with AHSA1/START domain